MGLPGGPVAKTLYSQRREQGLNPWSGNEVIHAATKSSHAATEDPACQNEDQRSHVLQLRPSAAK